MQTARQLDSFLRLIKLPVAARGVPVGRCASTKARHDRRAIEDESSDFRAPWVYSGSRFLTYTTIPLALFYCAFLADWGEREHVFMPLRRWASRYKQSILSLSPEEVALVRGNDEQVSGSSLAAPAEKNS